MNDATPARLKTEGSKKAINDRDDEIASDPGDLLRGGIAREQLSDRLVIGRLLGCVARLLGTNLEKQIPERSKVVEGQFSRHLG
jgi:hypothetical protein